MLETIREYAAERLREREDDATIRDQHLAHYLALAERAHEEVVASASEWFAIVDAEHDNIRTALDWATPNRPESAAQLAGAIAEYWVQRGHALEARERLGVALVQYGSHDRVRARALTGLGNVIAEIGDDQEGLSYLDEALDVWREVGDARGEAGALEGIGYCQIALRELGAARLAFERSLSLRQQAGAPEVEIAESLAGLCQLLVASGDITRAEPLAQELYDIGTRNKARRRAQSGLHYLADCALIGGNYAEAEDRYVRALEHAHRWGILRMRTAELLGVAMSTAGRGNDARAVRLAAAAYAESELLGTHGTTPFWTELQERHILGARAHLSPDEVEEAERAGREVAFDAVLDEVLGVRAASAQLTSVRLR
jgi:tetratricopeptide (TPR) repeat protein